MKQQWLIHVIPQTKDPVSSEHLQENETKQKQMNKKLHIGISYSNYKKKDKDEIKKTSYIIYTGQKIRVTPDFP